MKSATAAAFLLIAATAAKAEEPLERVVVAGPDGETAPLAERVTPPAILHFWATWCAPCLEELPEVAAFAEERPDLFEGVAVVSVDTAPYERVENFLDERLGLPDLPTLKVVEGNAGATFGIMGYPSTVFLNAEGMVSRRHQGVLDWASEEVRADFAAHLAEEP